MDDSQLSNSSSSAPGSMKIYSIYRTFQVCALLLIFFLLPGKTFLGKDEPFLFAVSAFIYLTFCSYTLGRTLSKQNKPLSGFHILFVLLSDIAAIMSFIHFSGGLNGSLSILLTVTIAAASILLTGRFAFFIAAIASISILAEQTYLYWLSPNVENVNFTQTGILGFAFFGAALITQQLAVRLRDSEQFATEKIIELEELEKINEQIIERMPTGVIVVNDIMEIKFMNSAAWRMLGMPNIPTLSPLDTLSTELNRQLNNWLLNANTKLVAFTASKSGSSLSANFIHLGETPEAGILIYLDDSSLMSEQAQRLKLASLGTLTAGIAHEIRNPLGAISHAAQLLLESEELSDADLRLANIVQHHSLRMNRIIENVLQISRQKANHTETINLVDWLNKFIQDFKSAYKETIIVQLNPSDHDVKIKVDTSHLSQVLTNLCENGLKYSFEHSQQYQITLTTGIDIKSRFPFIDIVDKGPGILPEEAEHIFEPFYTTSSTGSGLGLYIAQELCEANRARLDYIPIPTGGSCFRITFTLLA